MDKKIKIVFMAISELTKRYFEWWDLETLSEKFDVEYWDVSRLSLNGFKAKDKVEFQQSVTIHTIKEFENNLKRIPKDTIITPSLLFLKEDYKWLKVLSKYFPKLCFIYLYNCAEAFDFCVTNDTEGAEERTNNHSKSLKQRIYTRYPAIKMIVKSIRHPEHRESYKEVYYRQKCMALFEWHDMWNKVGAKYFVNSVNVNQYMRCKNKIKVLDLPKKYIVYIDQYFPYHNELKIYDPKWDADNVATTHFAKVNKYFDKIEDKYKCPIIIAAHPVSNYTKNPYGGREMKKYCTNELVVHSSGVLMHNSGSLAYAMLADKPLVILTDTEFRISPWNDSLIHLQNQGLFTVDLDEVHDDTDVIIPPIPHDTRMGYLNNIVGGEFDEDKWIDNSQLIAENYVKIYHEMYG